jgi:hypothetical protein
MKVKKLNIYNQDPERGVSNEYDTPPDAFRQPALWYVSAVRNSHQMHLGNPRFGTSVLLGIVENLIYVASFWLKPREIRLLIRYI